MMTIQVSKMEVTENASNDKASEENRIKGFSSLAMSSLGFSSVAMSGSPIWPLIIIGQHRSGRRSNHVVKLEARPTVSCKALPPI